MRIFIIGQGNLWALKPPKYLYNGKLSDEAEAFATAIETAKIAFAPKFFLFSVPSRSHIILSINRCWYGLVPTKWWAKVSLIFFTALYTDLPKYTSSLSRSSTASNAPVDAPLGTIADCTVPSDNVTVASTVGLPLESRTCLPFISSINIHI